MHRRTPVESPAQALAHEGAAAAVPATPGEDTAYEDAVKYRT